MIGSVIKYFRFSYDYVLWEISFSNLNMLLASIPDNEPVEAGDKEEIAEPVDNMAELAQWMNK